MKLIFITIFLCISHCIFAQELYVYTEPASNMATKSIGVRASNYLLKENNINKYDYQLIPEIMWGVSKKVMVHAEGFFSNKDKKFKAEGGALYFKYRFYSQDEVHSHFRMAAFARGSYNNSHIHQPAIDINGFNSGYEAGMIATRLISKLALSSSASFLHATDNGNNYKFPFGDNSRNAIGYSFSAGKLMLPKAYTSYNQTNVNLMLETLGQWNIGSGKSYVDLAPSIQFIFLSKMRLDIGYRFAVVKDLQRNMENSFLLRVEYNFFNAYK